MAWQWNPWALPGFFVFAVIIAMAVAVYRTRPRARENRAMAASLALMAVFTVSGWGMRLLVNDPGAAFAWWFTSLVALILAGPVFLEVVASVVGDGTSWLRTRWFRVPVWTLALLIVGAILASPALAGRSVSYAAAVGTYIVLDTGPLWMWGLLFLLATLFAAPLALIGAYRSAATDARRRRLRSLFVPYAVVAILWAAFMAFVFTVTARGLPYTDAFVVINFVTLPLIQFVFVSLLALSILRYQWFGLDLHIKWTINRGAVASVFLLVFLVVGVMASEYLVNEAGYVVGGLAAGLLLFALRPLEQFGQRLADAAMPNVKDTEEYRTVRRREVYEAAVHGALEDGVITERERDMLAALADSLELSAVEARRIERSAAA